MKKSIVIIPAVVNTKLNDKYGGWNWMDISIKAWKYWCKKNGHELVIYDECSLSDLVKYRVTVQRWFDIHDFLDEKGIKYSKALMVDACSIPKWDCPDFFKLAGDNMCGMYDMDNLGWVNVLFGATPYCAIFPIFRGPCLGARLLIVTFCWSRPNNTRRPRLLIRNDENNKFTCK